MLFNSLIFPFFLVGMVVCYYITPHRYRWMLLLGASYYFYGSWKVEYVFLLAGSTLVDYLCALGMQSARSRIRRQLLLIISIVTNLLILILFKYYSFISDELRSLLAQYSVAPHIPYLEWVLPIGISFYTLQTIGYSIDVYRGRRPAERHLGKFALYVSFFPQLVAGPIERSTRLLPQFSKKVRFDTNNLEQGLMLILWGFYKKLVISDNLSLYIDPVFESPDQFSPASLILATYMVLFRMYCDFSGYTDIARGSALLFGIQLMKNFNRPYAATSIREFWQRWHISLTQWMFAYLYNPMVKGRKQVLWLQRSAVIIVFLLVGLWHGASWNFVLFGLYYGLLLVCGDWIAQKIEREKKKSEVWLGISRIWDAPILGFILTFHAIWLASILFTLPTVSDALLFFQSLAAFGSGRSTMPVSYPVALAIIGVVLMECVQFAQSRFSGEIKITELIVPVRWGVYYLLFFSILMFGNFNANPFIYFQF